jgi:hypothetical protein
MNAMTTDVATTPHDDASLTSSMRSKIATVIRVSTPCVSYARTDA